MKKLIILSIFIFAITSYLLVFSQQCSICDSSSCKDYCSGNTLVYRECRQTTCCIFNTTTNQCEQYNIECVEIGRENCNQYDKFVCGCTIGNSYYRKDKYVCFEDWYCETLGTDSYCSYRYIDPTYCGETKDSDGGDNPRVKGIVTDKYCENGTCKSKDYIDTCQGICSRSELKEYYVESDRVAYKVYTDLFSKNQYCKDGAIYDDVKNPIVILSPSSRNWASSDVTVTLTCNDNNESGCWKYSYVVNKVV
jgi:hypothetical protein